MRPNLVIAHHKYKPPMAARNQTGVNPQEDLRGMTLAEIIRRSRFRARNRRTDPTSTESELRNS